MIQRWLLLVVLLAAANDSAVRGEEDSSSTTEPRHSSRSIKIAGILFEPARSGDYKAQNFQEAERLIRQAAAAGAELVCTYEQFLDGYGFDANKMSGPEDPHVERCEILGQSEYLSRLGELAADLNIGIVAGVAILEGDRTFNSTVLYDAKGEQVGIYRKTHNAGKYARWFAPLSAAEQKAACPSFSLGGGRLSVKICNDRRFPETTDHMVENGCELLLCPAYGKYTPDQLLSDTERFGLWAVFVHPQGCQFIDSGTVVRERTRKSGESCFVLHEVSFRQPLRQTTR